MRKNKKNLIKPTLREELKKCFTHNEIVIIVIILLFIFNYFYVINKI